MTISLATFRAACPSNAEPAAWVDALNDVLPRYEIDTPEREAMFLAHTSHESLDYVHLRENLNYSAAALLRVWSKRYTVALANAHARKPELIANHVYGGRMGNVKTGDGWRFRGGGLIQLTGRGNYEAFGATVKMSAEQASEYVVTKPGAIASAAWFWTERNLNQFADESDVYTATRIINGGLNGIDDRLKRYRRILATY